MTNSTANNNTTLEQLANKFPGSKIWEGYGRKRLYIESEGDTKKVKTITYIFINENGNPEIVA